MGSKTATADVADGCASQAGGAGLVAAACQVGVKHVKQVLLLLLLLLLL